MKTVRSIRDTVAMIKEEDPDTAITEFFIRNMVNIGEIPSYSYKNKKLISYEDVEAFFSSKSNF